MIKNKGLTGSTLKWIAIILMVVDHVGAILIEYNALNAIGVMNNPNFIPTVAWQNWSAIDFALRCIGRISFPLFCFLLVEGFVHTHDAKKYALRLGLFALISEIPFNLAVLRVPFTLTYQNVFFTLLIGFLVLMGLKKVDNKAVPSFFIIVAGCVAAFLLKTDYSFTGVLVIVGFYQFRDKFWMCFVFVSLILLLMTMLELPGLLAFLLIASYNGEKGKGPKYFFYSFYPIHLFILYIISLILPVFPV